MSIKSEITRINQNITAAYNSAKNKAATIPVIENLNNLATCIDSINSSGQNNEIPSYQVESNIATRRQIILDGTEFKNIIDIADKGLFHAFYNCTNLTGKFSMPDLTTLTGNLSLVAAFYNTNLTTVDLSSLTSITGTGLSQAFYNCTGLTSVDLSSLTSIGNSGSLFRAFYGCTSLTTVDLSSLTTASSAGMLNTFQNCTSLTNIDLSSLSRIIQLDGTFYKCTSLTTLNFPSLTYINYNSQIFPGAFSNCTNLADIYFNALTTTSFGSYTNQFKNMMANTGTDVIHTIHFPSNLESTIQGLTNYPLFGGTSGYVTLAFDLPATS